MRENPTCPKCGQVFDVNGIEAPRGYDLRRAFDAPPMPVRERARRALLPLTGRRLRRLVGMP